MITVVKKQRVVQIPGASIVGDDTCGGTVQCCPDVVVPEEWGCSTPDLGTLPSSIIITLSGATGGQSGYYGIYEKSSSGTICGYDYNAYYLHYLHSWANGSYGMNYIGAYSGADINACSPSPFADTCRYHVYALSTNEVAPGFLTGGTPPVTSILNAAPVSCCCGTGVNLYRDITDNELYLQYTSDRNMCAEFSGALSIPCEADSIETCAGLMWNGSDFIAACIGESCPPCCLVPNGDVFGGLYCDGGTIAQYPYRARLDLYRQALFLIPQDTLENNMCCLDSGLLILKTFVIARRWLDDGSSRISNEPTVVEYDQSVGILFDGGGTISGSGSTSGSELCSLWPCYDLLHTQDIELNAAP